MRGCGFLFFFFWERETNSLVFIFIYFLFFVGGGHSVACIMYFISKWMWYDGEKCLKAIYLPEDEFFKAQKQYRPSYECFYLARGGRIPTYL